MPTENNFSQFLKRKHVSVYMVPTYQQPWIVLWELHKEWRLSSCELLSISLDPKEMLPTLMLHELLTGIQQELKFLPPLMLTVKMHLLNCWSEKPTLAWIYLKECICVSADYQYTRHTVQDKENANTSKWPQKSWWPEDLEISTNAILAIIFFCQFDYWI